MFADIVNISIYSVQLPSTVKLDYTYKTLATQIDHEKGLGPVKPNDTLLVTQWVAIFADATKRLGFKVHLQVQVYYRSEHPDEYKLLFVHL